MLRNLIWQLTPKSLITTLVDLNLVIQYRIAMHANKKYFNLADAKVVQATNFNSPPNISATQYTGPLRTHNKIMVVGM